MIANTNNLQPNQPDNMTTSMYDTQIQQVIELSKQTALMEQYGMQYTRAQLNTLEPFEPEELLRQDGVPVGLKNVGNTCYINSLLQSYFMIPSFYKMVMEYTTHPTHLIDLESSTNQKMRACIRMLHSLKELFAFLVKSNRKYIIPSEVLDQIIDESGNKVQFGQQADIGEFNMLFLTSTEAALKTQDADRQMSNQQIPSDLSLVESIIERAQNKDTPTKITSMFYGKQKQILNFQDTNQSLTKIENTQDFGVIMLNIDAHHENLYSAWSKSIKSTIEGFRSPTGNLTTCEQEVWIETLPDVLMFQLSRYTFDAQDMSSKKLNNYFEFPEVLYADMYMHDNIELVRQITLQESLLLDRIKVLECVLKTYDNYSDTDQSVNKLLDSTLDFLTQQLIYKNIPKMVKYGEGMSFCPVNKTLDPIDDKQELDIQNACSLLYNIKIKVQSERQKVLDQLQHARVKLT